MKQRYFISGHRDITKEEFNRLYVPVIQKILDNESESEFIVGDYYGVDMMAQQYLSEHINDKTNVTVCHMFINPKNCADNKFRRIGGFNTDEERDAYMTRNSDIDIAFVRKGKDNSGTARNIIRRHEFKA